MMIYRVFILLFYVLPCNSQTLKDSIVHLIIPEVTVRAGEKGLIHFHVSVKEGYHIQANKVNDEFIIPTTLEIDTHEILTAEEPMFPVSKKFRLEGSSDYLLVYDGSFKIIIPIRAGEKVKKGKYNLTAKLRYQACDDKTCFFPKTFAFSITIKVI
jgi:thiol:disulfide interchange protein DsbD